MRLWRKMGKPKLPEGAGAPVSPAAAPLRRRSQRLVVAAEPSEVQIPASSPRQATRPPSRRASPRRIQSRGAAEPSEVQIPASSPRQATRPPSRRASPRRIQTRGAGAAEPSEVQIPASSPRQATRPPSRRASPRRIQTRGSNRRTSAALQKKKKNAPYFWGARRPRSALAAVGNHFPALSPIQLLGKKRGFYFCANSPAWGAKRARSAICCGGGDDKPVDPAPAQDVDWANLGDGPAGLIADLLLANDVADYVRFRAVCQPWRRCSLDPRGGGLDGRFLPRRWIMLDKAITANPRCHRFLNISTGESIRMDLHELAEHKFLALTPEGLLLLLHEPTRIIRLLNPLTRQLTNLPPVTSLQDQRATRSMEEWFSIEVYGVGLADASTVAVCFIHPRILAVAKPGDVSWTTVYSGFLHSTLSYAGRFYCCVGTRLMVLSTTTTDQQPPRLMVAAERSSHFYFSQMADSLHLVDNAGSLMMVHRSLYEDSEHNYKRKYQLYRVDLDAGVLVPTKSFNGRALFMGCRRTISLAAETFPSITADSLYLGYDFDENRRINAYNRADGSSDASHDSRDGTYPCSIITCLSHCIQYSGKELA